MLFVQLLLTMSAWAAQVARAPACGPELDRLVVGHLGISDAELRELVAGGAVEPKRAKHRPRLVNGEPALEAFRARNRRYEYETDDAEAQLKRAALDAWARSVADVLSARYPRTDFATDAYLSFIRALAIEFKGSASYSPSGPKIRRAAEVSDLPKTQNVSMPRLRTLAKALGIKWTRVGEESGDFGRAIEAALANLPSSGGAVLSLRASVLDKISWQERAAPALKRIEREDLEPLTPAR